MNTYFTATLQTLGESEKINESYTLYDYVELKVEGKIEQIRDVIVSDTINAGLIVGEVGDFVIANYVSFSAVQYAEERTECVAFRTKETERSNYDTLVYELRNRPTVFKFFSWLLGTPIRVFSRAREEMDVFGALMLFCILLLFTPVLAPFTYLSRIKKHRVMVRESKNLLKILTEKESTLICPTELQNAILSIG